MTGYDAGNARAQGTRWGQLSAEGDVTETTALLETATAEPHPEVGKDVWVGAEDFDGFPWWRRPSVGPHNSGLSLLVLNGLDVDGRYTSRFTGYFHPGFSLSLLLAAHWSQK